VTRAPSDRSHLSIGEVLSLLQEEFPDVTISKIRFLESQGLLDPERTPSGYRKFYEADIDRLRWILRQQKDHYLPLKVIKDRLDDPAVLAMAERNGGSGTAAEPGRLALALDDRPPPARPADDVTAPQMFDRDGGAPPSAPAPAPADPTGPGRAAAPERPAPPGGAAPPATARAAAPGPAAGAAPERAPEGPATPSPSPRRAARAPDPSSLSLTADELAHASGLSVRDVRDLERFGLLEGSTVGEQTYYDGDALVIARTAAGFLQHGIEARHMRSYKVAIDREAGLFDQIVAPVLKQRNPEARRRAAQTVVELMRLGEEMRNVLLRRELRDHLPPG
jgi:DNA-binding transcriptional MerR regulator